MADLLRIRATLEKLLLDVLPLLVSVGKSLLRGKPRPLLRDAGAIGVSIEPSHAGKNFVSRDSAVSGHQIWSHSDHSGKANMGLHSPAPRPS